ncbi:unannotated protein [freshwater metagenome]|uniref:Unannotated protein n=1 Tax=freshwater metagenome TaxID=449393 RepID=A0A6J5ZLT0_9ZZZZ
MSHFIRACPTPTAGSLGATATATATAVVGWDRLVTIAGRWATIEGVSTDRVLKVLIYSDDSTVRHSVRVSLGNQPAADVVEVDYLECATEPAVVAAMDKKRFDLVILDGEAVPSGGLGITRALKDEIFNCPPILVIVGRDADKWLATWSGADAIIMHPIDPRALVKAALDVLDAHSVS